jgi:hypothetical protein
MGSATDKGPQLRKQSRSNIDIAFNCISLFLNITRQPYASELNGNLHAVFTQLALQMEEKPADMIRHMRLLRSSYLTSIRGFSMSEAGYKQAEWDKELGRPRALNDILVTRLKWASSSEQAPMLDFDRAVVAMLSLSRVVVTDRPLDTSTITEPYPTKDVLPLDTKEKFKFLDKVLKEMGISPDAFKARSQRECESLKFYVSTKAGPNGHATLSANLDARLWRDPSVAEVRKDFDTFLLKSGLVDVAQELIRCGDLSPLDEVSTDKLTLGKIVPIEEWGDKTRGVAILDYWTQVALTPLHNTVQHFLD